MSKLTVAVDLEVEAASVHFQDQLSDHVTSFGDSVNVDLNSDGHIVAVEFLSFRKLDRTREELKAMNPHGTAHEITAVEDAQLYLVETLSKASLKKSFSE